MWQLSFRALIRASSAAFHTQIEELRKIAWICIGILPATVCVDTVAEVVEMSSENFSSKEKWAMLLKATSFFFRRLFIDSGLCGKLPFVGAFLLYKNFRRPQGDKV